MPSLADEQHAFAKALVEAAALRELLSRRRKGAFVGVDVMDARLAGMVADKRRVQGLRS